ncbi:MAG: cupin domain-containing protein, partial [Acidimicrobiia bacterium]
VSTAIRRVSPGERVEGGYTAGMVREEAISTDGMWSGFVRTDPGSISGWHHHGEYETSIYVLKGAVKLEFGAGGQEVVEAVEGDFLLVPPHSVHRESNPGNFESHLIVVRAGTGEPVFNAEGPG